MNEFESAPILATNFITIEGFESLSKQDMFDKAAAHIIANGPSFNIALDACRYGGSGCAAAVFIREDLRAIADQHGSWRTLETMRLVPLHNFELIRSLQDTHDGSVLAAKDNGVIDHNNFFTLWQAEMKTIAKFHGLSSAAVDNIP